MPEEPEDMVASERAAKLGWQLALGEVFTNRQAADFLGISVSWARRLLCQLSRVLPIYYDDSRPGLDGYWFSTQHYDGFPDRMT